MSRRCVTLIGMMGAGKTEVGELLAEQLGYDFIDTDKLIRKRAGKSINAIFREDGEHAFRELESAVIHELKEAQSTVIAPGGGAVINPENFRTLMSLGLTFYLSASPRELYQRVKNDKGRPLLDVEDPIAAVRDLLAERESFYQRADITIDTEDLSVDEVVEKIIDELAKRTVDTQM